MKRLFNPRVIIPIALGLSVGAVLFLLGDADDAPGLCLIGLIIAFVMSMWGINRSGVITAGYFVPILMLCFGIGGLLLSSALQLDGEFRSLPWLPIVIVFISLVLIYSGMRKIKT